MRQRTVAVGRFAPALAAIAGVVAAGLVAAALRPAQAEALPNPFDAVGSLFGAAGDVAGQLGAGVLQDALEWLLGGLKGAITLELVQFLTTIELPVGGALSDATGPIIVVGGFFLVVGLITSIGDGYVGIVAGTDTAPRVVGGAIFRVVGLAILLGAWFWIVPLAVEVANGLSSYVLSDGAVASALRRTFAGESLLSIGFPLLGLLTGIFMAMAILTLVVLKFVLAIAFACLYVGGPALIGFAALPRVGTLPLALATRGVVTLMVVPLAWTVVFVAWAGVSAGMFDAAGADKGPGVVGALMGPGLFLAGLVVMLAVTKKVLAMASFGLPLKVPFSGAARMTVRSTAIKVAAPMTGAVDAAAKVGGTTAMQQPSTPAKGGGGQPVTPGGSGVATIVQTGPSRPDRKKLDTGGSSTLDERFELRQRQIAEVEESYRMERVRDAQAITDVKGGGWQRRPGPIPTDEALSARVDELRAGQGEVLSAETLRRHGNDLPAGDRAALAGAGRWALEEHYGHPERAELQYRETATRQFAGLVDRAEHPERFEAAAIAIAAPPAAVDEAYGAEYDRFRWKSPDPEPVVPGATKYDPEIFTWGRKGGPATNG